MAREEVHVRLTQMPCCGHLLVTVTERFPTFCPECGKLVYPGVKSCVMAHDPKAVLRYDFGDQLKPTDGETSW